MATIQYISFQNLQTYDQLLKNYVAAEDAKSIKSAAIDGYHLKLYTIENPTAQDTPKYNITLPQQDLSNFVEKVIQGTNGTARIFNEADGGGSKFEHKDGTWSFAGVNDGGANGLAAQIYAVNKDTKTGSRINVTVDGIYYTSGRSSMAYTADDEIATVGQLGGEAASKTVYLEDESQGQSEYAKVYKIYQGANASDMSQNTFVGAINIPLDKVVQDGHLVTVTNGVDSDGDTVPSGVADGTYIKLTFQNVAQAVYINVADLVDAYTGGTTAEITISIDSNNEITATINEINGSKIADGSIAKAKLVTSVQDALDAGSTALQPEDITPVDTEDIENLFS